MSSPGEDYVMEELLWEKIQRKFERDGVLLDFAFRSTETPRSRLADYAWNISWQLHRFTARAKDQQTIVPEKTDRTDSLRTLGQEILLQYGRRAKPSNDPTRSRYLSSSFSLSC